MKTNKILHWAFWLKTGFKPSHAQAAKKSNPPAY